MSRVNPVASPGNRACGTCTACCVHLPIPAGQVGPGAKPGGVRCPHVCATGCRIYGRRPEMCANFQCAWLTDATWPEGWRPEQSGFLCLRENIEDGLPAAAVYELRPQVIQQPVAAEILNELKRTTAVIALINSRQYRERVAGNWVTMPAEPTIPAPHFLAPKQNESRSDTTRIA